MRTEQCSEQAGRAFFDGWLDAVRVLLEKAIYEVHYELNNRPDWIAIPALGLRGGCCGDPSSRMRMRRISARSLRVPNTFCKC